MHPAAGFFICDEDEDAVNMATMPAQQQQMLHAVQPASGRPAAHTGRVSEVQHYCRGACGVYRQALLA
jgi:hypothetical protein